MRVKLKLVIVLVAILISFIIIRLFFMKNYYDLLEYWSLKDKIVWVEKNKLEWSDFNYDEDKDGIYAKVGLAARYNVNDPILFRSNTAFIPKKSYVSDTTDINSLRIAQVKYDLLETYRRKMVKEVDSLRIVKVKDLKPDDFHFMNERYYDKFDQEWQIFLNANDEEKALETLENKVSKKLTER